MNHFRLEVMGRRPLVVHENFHPLFARDRFYGFDLYESGSSAGWSTANAQLVEIDLDGGSIEPVGAELDGDFVDLTFDYSRDLVDRDVIWAIRNTFSVEEVDPTDGTNPEGDFVVALSDNALRGLAIAPSTFLPPLVRLPVA